MSDPTVSDDDGSYYLIHLGRDIAKCPGDATRASLHLSQIRRDIVEEHRQATGRDPETVPWLIGVYPPGSVGGPDGKGGVFSYGYSPTMLGHINVPRSRWHRLT